MCNVHSNVGIPLDISTLIRGSQDPMAFVEWHRIANYYFAFKFCLKGSCNIFLLSNFIMHKYNTFLYLVDSDIFLLILFTKRQTQKIVLDLFSQGSFGGEDWSEPHYSFGPRRSERKYRGQHTPIDIKMDMARRLEKIKIFYFLCCY